MELIISDFEVKQLPGQGHHKYLVAQYETDEGMEAVSIFFQRMLEEKKIFNNAKITLSGEMIKSEATLQVINATILKVQLKTEIPMEGLTIKDRLNASGLIHEFRAIYRKDKIRALEILKVLGVSDKFAEEILLRNSYILPFI